MRSYLAVLRVRHARPLLVAALVGRLSFAMGTVALVLFVQHATGSFAVAGVVSAAAFLANGLLAPVRGRLVDRYGLRRTLPSLAVGYAAALVGLVVAVSADPANTLAAAGLAGVVALEQAVAAQTRGDVPIGAVVLDGTGAVLAAAGNEREQAQDPTAHAEVLALRAAAHALGAHSSTVCRSSAGSCDRK